MTFALDSNTVSYLLRGEGDVKKRFEREIVQAGNSYAIPLIVVFEVKRWLLDKPTAITRAYDKAFDAMLQPVRAQVEMPVGVWLEAVDVYISLKRKGRLIGDSDIIIAAYCLVNGYTLVTRNTNDFGRIDGLKLVDWY
jgi:tRNA(fMet)-specific endonuclease VapC